MTRTLSDLIYEFLDIILNYAVPTIFGLGVAYFLYGVVRYIKSGGSQEKRSEGVKFMSQAVISLFIMLTIWAIVGVFSSFFGSNVGIPQFQKSNPAQKTNTVI